MILQTQQVGLTDFAILGRASLDYRNVIQSFQTELSMEWSDLTSSNPEFLCDTDFIITTPLVERKGLAGVSCCIEKSK
jgi:hypothetical protein